MQRYDMCVAYYSPDAPYVEAEPVDDGSWVRATDVERLEQIERAAKALVALINPDNVIVRTCMIAPEREAVESLIKTLEAP